MTDTKHDKKHDTPNTAQRVKDTADALKALRKEAEEHPALLDSLALSTDTQAIREAHVRSLTLQADILIAEIQHETAKIASYQAREEELKARRHETAARLNEAVEVENMAKTKRQEIGHENQMVNNMMFDNAQSIGVSRQRIEHLNAQLRKLRLPA